MSSAICFNLDQSKILSSVNELTCRKRDMEAKGLSLFEFYRFTWECPMTLQSSKLVLVKLGKYMHMRAVDLMLLKNVERALNSI